MLKMDNFDITVLVPTLNEEITISKFIDSCRIGFKKLNLNGQIIIADSSSDNTSKIAREKNVEVVIVPQKGLGNAYKAAIPYIKSQYVILGDADLTYDFSNIEMFYNKLKEGYEFIVGNRFKGYIEQGAMPKSHQYFGSPATSWLLNLVFQTPVKDIHCGMRAVTTRALKRMNLVSKSWQYASEMIIKAKHLKLKTTEIPISFYKDKQGRISNLKRIGFWAPWHAGWITIQTILTWGISQIFIPLGYVLIFLSLPLLVILYDGPATIMKYELSLHSMMFLSLIFQVGFQLLMLGIVSKLFYEVTINKPLLFLQFNYSICIFITLMIVSIFFLSPIFSVFHENSYTLPNKLGYESYYAVTGINLMALGTAIFVYSLLYNLIFINRKNVETN
jgi:glycosyltransferase involved in cell wall biosynthesis